MPLWLSVIVVVACIVLVALRYKDEEDRED